MMQLESATNQTDGIDPKQAYRDLIRLIERLHRRFLDVVKAELDRQGIEDINNIQSLLLVNIETEQVTIGELTTRGYYLGSNVSYNVKKLVENGYLVQERSAHDRRTSRVRVTAKGLDIVSRINTLYEQNLTALNELGLTEKQMTEISESMRQLERFWADYINYGPR